MKHHTARSALILSTAAAALMIQNAALSGPHDSDNYDEETQSCSILMQAAPKILWEQLWVAVQEQTPGLTHSQRAALLQAAGAFSVPTTLKEHWRLAPLQEALTLTQALLTEQETASAENEFREWLIQMVPLAERKSALIGRLVHSTRHQLKPHTVISYTRHIGSTRFIPLRASTPSDSGPLQDWIELYQSDVGGWASRVSLPQGSTSTQKGSERFDTLPDFGPAYSGRFQHWIAPWLTRISPRLSPRLTHTLHASISSAMDLGVSYGEEAPFVALWDLTVRPSTYQPLPLAPKGIGQKLELATAEISPDGRWVAIVTGPPHDRSKQRAYIPKTLTLRIWDVKNKKFLATTTDHELSAVVMEGIGLVYEQIRAHWDLSSQHLFVTARDHYRATESSPNPAQGGWLFSGPLFSRTQHFPTKEGGVRAHAFAADGSSVLVLGDNATSDLALKHIRLSSSAPADSQPLLDSLAPALLDYSIQQLAQFAVGQLDGMPVAFAVSPQADLWMAAPEGWVQLAHGFPAHADWRFPSARVSEVHWVERDCELLAEFPTMGLLRWDLRYLSPRCR